ncbi:ATP-binding protein [Bacillus cereus]
MKNSYQQLTTNLEYLKLKQMTQHLGDVVILALIMNYPS